MQTLAAQAAGKGTAVPLRRSEPRRAQTALPLLQNHLVLISQRREPNTMYKVEIIYFKKINVTTLKDLFGDFPGGTVVENLPANAGDTGSSPGPGRSHMAVEQLSPCTTTTEPAL